MARFYGSVSTNGTLLRLRLDVVFHARAAAASVAGAAARIIITGERCAMRRAGAWNDAATAAAAHSLSCSSIALC